MTLCGDGNEIDDKNEPLERNQKVRNIELEVLSGGGQKEIGWALTGFEPVPCRL